MEHKMRRFKQLLSPEESELILRRGTNGILSLVDSDGWPYGVPLNYVWDGKNSIYFHSARSGHKIECMENDSRCSFCIVDRDMIVPEEFTSYFRSVIVTGNVHAIVDKEEAVKGLKLLCGKYSPGIDSSGEIERGMRNVTVLRLDVERITGKEAIELVAERKR